MKALVLAGGLPQITLINELKSRGVETVLADGNDKAIARPYADMFYRVNIFDIDAVVACIDALARNLAKMRLTAIRQVKDSVAVTETTSDVARVLKKPNKYMTQYDFIYKVHYLYFSMILVQFFYYG